MKTVGHAILARLLFQSGAIKFGSFKIKLHETNPTAPPSPIYLNLRTPDNGGTLNETMLMQIGGELEDLVKHHKIDFKCIAGVPNAGDPFAAALRRCLHLPDGKQIRMKKEKSEKGRAVTSILEDSHFAPKEITLLVDDLVTQADSKLEAIHVLKEAGLRVDDVVVLVDREQGGREQLERAGYALHAVFTITELMEFYQKEGLVPKEKCIEVLTYIAENRVH